jgi:hypothetical protein
MTYRKISGFHEQQNKIAKDHEEQMEIIRSLQQQMASTLKVTMCDTISHTSYLCPFLVLRGIYSTKKEST